MFSTSCVSRDVGLFSLITYLSSDVPDPLLLRDTVNQIEYQETLYLLQDHFIQHGIEFIAKQVVNNSFATVFTEVKKQNVYNILLDIKVPLLPPLFREARLGFCHFSSTKIIIFHPCFVGREACWRREPSFC